MTWDLLADDNPVRLGCRWMRAMDCPSFCGQPGPYIGGPGSLALALRGRTLFYVDTSEWLPGYRKTGIDAASFGPPFRPRRRLENRIEFRAAVKAARKYWAAYFSGYYAASLPPLYRSPIQRLADKLFGPRLTVGQVLLSTEREINWLRYSPSQVKYVREMAIVCNVPNCPPQLPGKEIIAHSVIDAGSQAKAGAHWMVRVWYLDHSLGDEDYFDGASHPAIGSVVDPASIKIGRESLPYRPPRRPPPLDPDLKRSLEVFREKFRTAQ